MIVNHKKYRVIFYNLYNFLYEYQNLKLKYYYENNWTHVILFLNKSMNTNNLI